MALEPKASLRVQALEKRLANHPNGARLFEYANALDGWIHEWAKYAARRDLKEDERVRALGMLASMRRDFNALLAEVDAFAPEAPSRASHFGTALDQLGEAERAALAQILGVPYSHQYRALFEVKAAEYLEQDELWNSITEQGGFVPASQMAEDAVTSAVVLTYSGSLLLVSAPTEKRNFRRKYVYQSIYAGQLPTEGSLGLLSPIRVNRPVAGTRIKTSPVRKLRVSQSGAPGWDQHRETFIKLHRTLNGVSTPHAMASPEVPQAAPSQPRAAGASTWVDGTPQVAANARPENAGEVPSSGRSKPPRKLGSGDKIPSVFVQVLHNERQRDQVKKLEDTARAELRTLLARLIDTAGERDHTLEAEIIGQVMYLQRLGVEKGELALAPQDLARLETENNDLCSSMPGGLSLGKVGQPTQPIPGANLGAQTIVRGAPVAVLSKDSSLFAVLGNCRSYVRRG